MVHCFYKSSIAGFINQDHQKIFGELCDGNGNSEQLQKNAWHDEIDLLQNALKPWENENGLILFEYSIPRLSRRIDVVLLMRNIVLVLEFKTGANTYLQADSEQAMDYALDLKYFHAESVLAPIVPILVATEANDICNDLTQYTDQVYLPLYTNADCLQDTIAHILDNVQSVYELNLEQWEISNYQPTPTIIEAARVLYSGNNVENITRTDATGESIRQTTGYVEDVVARTKEAGEKAICFVTGVPGAGKTLVGLNIAFRLAEQYKQADSDDGHSEAVYLSGNGPLVKVLVAALARDKKAREGGKISDAKKAAGAKVQSIYAFREQMLKKLKQTVVNKRVEIDPTHAVWSSANGYAEHEHIAIFDEAQRCWNHAKLADWLKRGGSYGNKLKIADFPMSEAEFLIWSLNLRPDWAVIICLVGGGQEIHTGEAGIGEWIRAINDSFPDWKVYVSDQLMDSEYEKGNTQQEINKLQHKEEKSLLHLKVSMRSFRSENLAYFVKSLLDRNVDEAKQAYQKLSEVDKETGRVRYPIVLTRDVEKAKQWLRQQARGTERYGLMVSSKAERLRPLAIDVKREIDVEKWFLDDKRELKSSFFMEDVATEFDVQGLELDWCGLVWDGDFRYSDNGWKHYQFSSNKWRNINNEDAREYQLNAYRVLLTRARQGMVICVPTGDTKRPPEDETRLPEYYDATYKYLKSIGIKEL